jgi:hypothetical protein
MHKVEQNYTLTHTHTHTHTHTKSPTKCPQFKCNTVSVSFSACRCNLVVLSSKVGRKRKKSVWRHFWEWYLQLWLACLLLSACSWRRYLCRSLGWASTHLVPQALFAQSSPVREPLLQAFPFPSTGKGDTAPAFSGLRVYLQFTWEVGLPPSPLKFSSHCHFHKLSCSCLLGSAAAPAGCHVCLQFTWEVGLPSSHKLLRSWLLGVRPAPARASPARLACLFTVPGRIPFPQSSALRAPHPLSSVS